MNKIFFRKYFITGLILLITFILTGCSNSNQLQVPTGGIITGNVQLNDSGLFTAAPAGIAREKDNDSSDNYPSVELNKSTIHAAVADPTMFIIKFSQQLTADHITDEIMKGKGRIVKEITPDSFKVIIPSSDQPELLDSINNNSLVEYIEPDYLVQIQNTPNDPDYSKQWSLKMLGLDKTWKTVTGSSQVTVAVIDTGILPDHPDLRDVIVPGYDFIDNDQDPTDTSPDFSHGTHVAGIIGAVTNNETGIAGINWQIRIMPVRVIGPEGSGGYSTLISGIRWAVDHGADVLNLSLAGSVDSSSLKEAVNYAVSNGVTVLAAAGNNGTSPILYPAKYDQVISVGSIGPTKEKAYYSNYGPDLDLVAPGGDNSVYTGYNTILSTAGYLGANGVPVHSYSWAQGTSMATPHVAGLTALLYARGIKDPLRIQQLLKETADDLGPAGPDPEYGAGLVNINRALNIDSGSNYSDNTGGGTNPGTDSSLNETKIFTASEDSLGLHPSSTSVHPDSQGNFALEAPAGTWSLIGWLDSNRDERINSGDYFGRLDKIRISDGQKITNQFIELKQVY